MLRRALASSPTPSRGAVRPSGEGVEHAPCIAHTGAVIKGMSSALALATADRQAPVRGSANGRPSGFGPEDASSILAPRAITGFFALLSPEQLKAALAYCGPDNIGGDEFKISTRTA